MSSKSKMFATALLALMEMEAELANQPRPATTREEKRRQRDAERKRECERLKGAAADKEGDQ